MILHIDGDDTPTLGSLCAKPSLCEGVKGPFFRAVIERCVSECCAHFGERLVAIYVYGSIHRDEAVPGVSDLDAGIFTADGFSPQDAEWRRQINDRLNMEFPPLPSGWMPRAIAVGTALPGRIVLESEAARIQAALRGIMQGVRPGEEASILLRRRGGAYLLRQDATRIWGDDLTTDLPAPPPDALWARVAFQCPWDGVRHAAGLGTARPTAFAEENVTEWGLPEEPARKLRKLARLAVLGGAYLLMACGEFRSYRACDVLPSLAQHYPQWTAFLDQTNRLCVKLADAPEKEAEVYLNQLVSWMDFIEERFPALID